MRSDARFFRGPKLASVTFGPRGTLLRAGDRLRLTTQLVERANKRGADPDLFAGLVYACRYCGLLQASVASYEYARRLDLNIRTSVPHTYFRLGDYRKVIATDNPATTITYLALGELGRHAEAIEGLRERESKITTNYRDFITAARALFEGNREESTVGS